MTEFVKFLIKKSLETFLVLFKILVNSNIFLTNKINLQSTPDKATALRANNATTHVRGYRVWRAERARGGLDAKGVQHARHGVVVSQDGEGVYHLRQTQATLHQLLNEGRKKRLDYKLG